jgi:hypothetical protein
LVDLINIFQLQQHIQSPTRTTHTTSSLIDIILTYSGDSKTLEAAFKQESYNLVSVIIVLFICAESSAFLRRHQKSFLLGNTKLRYPVFNLPMNTSISNDPNALWNDFKIKFLSVADKHAPIRQRRVKSEYKPWLTNQIKQMSYHRDYLERQSIKLGSTTYDMQGL